MTRERLHVGDFRNLSPELIEDESVELIFTDPPCDSLPLYEAAAKEAVRILKPGGSLIAYSGQVNFPAAIALIAKHLKYFWLCSNVHDGGPMSQMRQHGIVCRFKPLLWFVKDYRGDVQTFMNDTVLTKREKDNPWQQSVVTAEHFIHHLTSKNGCVVDFFVGGGTTMIAANRLGRRFVGFEIDPDTGIKAQNQICRRPQKEAAS